jgi:hypothetical protein
LVAIQAPAPASWSWSPLALASSKRSPIRASL